MVFIGRWCARRGKRLGPVGGRIVAEVFIGLLESLDLTRPWYSADRAVAIRPESDGHGYPPDTGWTGPG